MWRGVGGRAERGAAGQGRRGEAAAHREARPGDGCRWRHAHPLGRSAARRPATGAANATELKGGPGSRRRNQRQGPPDTDGACATWNLMQAGAFRCSSPALPSDTCWSVADPQAMSAAPRLMHLERACAHPSPILGTHRSTVTGAETRPAVARSVRSRPSLGDPPWPAAGRTRRSPITATAECRVVRAKLSVLRLGGQRRPSVGCVESGWDMSHPMAPQARDVPRGTPRRGRHCRPNRLQPSVYGGFQVVQLPSCPRLEASESGALSAFSNRSCLNLSHRRLRRPGLPVCGSEPPRP
jgi:hypothetical protein